jgi:hypothetical protein
MDFVMTGVKGIKTYINDILVHSRDHEQHLKTMEEVLWRLCKYGLKLNVDKTIIGAKTVQYFGYTLSGQGVTLSKDKLAAITDFPMPTSPKTVREFLGLANYFRSLIPRFSQTADPLNKMTRASTVWRTGAPPLPEAQAAFNKLKEALMSAPIVVNPNREGRFILQTHASTGTDTAGGGMGAVLLQEQKEKTERVVAYASRGLKDHKVNYPAFLLEKAAACWGIDYFDTYLTPPKQFTLRTDHRPLKTMSTVHKKTLNNLQLLMLKSTLSSSTRRDGGTWWRTRSAGRTQKRRYVSSRGQAGGRRRSTVFQPTEEQKKTKRRSKIQHLRTTERFRFKRS